MTLVEHLTELRKRLIICVLAVAVGMLVGFILYPWIFDFLIRPYKDIATADNAVVRRQALQIDPLEGFAVRIKTSAYTGIALAMPVILWQIWQFVTPGLYPHERRYAVPFVAAARWCCSVLGAGLAYYTLPRALDFLVEHRRRRPGHGIRAGQVLPAHHVHDAGVRHRLRVPDRAHLPADGRHPRDRDAAQGSALRRSWASWCWSR